MGIAIKKTYTKFEDLIFSQPFYWLDTLRPSLWCRSMSKLFYDKDRHNLTALMKFWWNFPPYWCKASFRGMKIDDFRLSMSVWWTLMVSDGLLGSLTVYIYKGFLWSLMFPEGFWWSMSVHECVWRSPMVYDGPLCSGVVPGSLWWFLMVYEGFQGSIMV